MRLGKRIPTSLPIRISSLQPGPTSTMRPTPSCPPTCGSLILRIGLPSGPAAVPFLVCKSVSHLARSALSIDIDVKARPLTALTDAGIENFREYFVVLYFGNRVVVLELDFASQLANNRDCLRLWYCGKSVTDSHL